MKPILILSLMLILPIVTDAYIVDYTIYNYKTLQPVQSVNITLTNATYETSRITDIEGKAFFAYINGSFDVMAFRSMYAEYSSNINITNDTRIDIMLSPYSHAGIVRITIADMTLAGNHVSCFYFDNNRQEGCYNSSNTEIILHNNMNYTWQPIIGKSDLVSSPTNIIKYSLLYYGAILGILITLLMGAFFAYLIVKIIFRK